MEQSTSLSKDADANSSAPQIFTTKGMGKEFCQGEIVSDILQYDYDANNEKLIGTPHKYAVILSQDCDLFNDYVLNIESHEYRMLGILIYKMYTVIEIRGRTEINATLWDRIVKNNDERYHYIEDCPKSLDMRGEGIPHLVVDFKRYFTVSPAALYEQFGVGRKGSRRCRLEVPYKEHLQSRAASYLQRVSVPTPHRKPPPLKV
jgi:hypothetical protein